MTADTPYAETNSSVHLFNSGAHAVTVRNLEAHSMVSHAHLILIILT